MEISVPIWMNMWSDDQECTKMIHIYPRTFYYWAMQTSDLRDLPKNSALKFPILYSTEFRPFGV